MDGRLTAGQAQLQAGNTFAAIRSAKQVLQDDPQDTNALELLCCAHMAERDYMSAQDVLDGWLRITPDDPDAHWTQILLQMSLGRQDDAKQRIAQFEQSFPESVHLTIWLQAMWQEAFGSPDKAIALYRTLLEREPGDISLIRRIALTEVEARNIIAASELMQDVLAHNANDADALRTLAISELKTFRFASARELATAAQAANPRDLAMKKVKWLSWIVLFPPFLAGHVLHYLIAYVRYAAGSIASAWPLRTDLCSHDRWNYLFK